MNRFFRVLAVVLATMVLIMGGCDTLGLLPDDDDDDAGDTIPEDVVDVAAGVLDLIDMAMSGDDPPSGPDSDDYPDGYPTGMSVAWTDTEHTTLRLTLSDFTPPEDDPPTVNGSVTISDEWTAGSSTATMTVSGSLSMTNFDYSTCSIDATARFAADTATGEWIQDEPESVTGTFSLDGATYDFAAILDAIEEMDHDDGDDGDEPLLTYSVTITGVDAPSVSGGEAIVVVFPGTLSGDPAPEDVLAVGRVSIDGATVTTNLYQATVVGSGDDRDVVEGTALWERTLGASYHLVVCLDTERDGPGKGDYFVMGSGRPSSACNVRRFPLKVEPFCFRIRTPLLNRPTHRPCSCRPSR